MTNQQFGNNTQFSPFNIFQSDALSGMGDYFTQEVGSLNWIEATVQARMIDTAFNFMQLMSNQIQPSSASVFLDRWANIYNVQGLSNTQDIKDNLQLIQSLTGTPPTYANVNYLLQQLLGKIFLGLQWIPENQFLATINPQTLISNPVSQYQMPLSQLVIYVWQPRDNEDNFYISTPVFNNLINSVDSILKTWLPHYTKLVTMNLISLGADQTVNTVTGKAGTIVLTGTNTTFTTDFYVIPGSDTLPYSIAITPPIQIVDDAATITSYLDGYNTVQTYYVADVLNDTLLYLTTPLIHDVTMRTYRCLGVPMDTPGVADGAALCNNYAG
jgi:hypothetical protein